MESLEGYSSKLSIVLSRGWNWGGRPSQSFNPELVIRESTLDSRFVLDCVQHLKYNTMPKAEMPLVWWV